MGCWNQTCSLTNLPIRYEDKIVVVPLMLLNEKIDGLTYNINDKYSPFCIPIIGTYNDYGGIEDVENENMVMSILEKLNFLVFNKDEDVLKDVTFISCENFFDTILEENLYIVIDEEIYKINYMMIHYDLYKTLIDEISFRNVNCDKNKNYRSILKDKICHFISNANKMGESSKTKEELLNELASICSKSLNDFDEKTKKRILKDISSPACFLKISETFLKGFVYNLLIEFLIDKNNDETLNNILNMLMFEKALQLLRSGYLINTGLGHQGCELKLHLLVNNFINSYIQTTINMVKENFYTESEINDYLKEEIFWIN